MDKKQVIIVALLIVAIVVSATSIALNISTLSPLNKMINGNAVAPEGNIAIEILKDVSEESTDGIG